MTRNDKIFQREVREFKRSKKVDLVDLIFKLQELNLSLKKRIVELERMLEERGDTIVAMHDAYSSGTAAQIEAEMP